MNINQLLHNAQLNTDSSIEVFVCDMNECRFTIDVINQSIAPNQGDLHFSAIVNMELDVDDRKLLLQQLKQHVAENTLAFVPHVENELLEKFIASDSCLDQSLCFGHQEEFSSPYSVEVNERLTKEIQNLFDSNDFEITYI